MNHQSNEKRLDFQEFFQTEKKSVYHSLLGCIVGLFSVFFLANMDWTFGWHFGQNVLSETLFDMRKDRSRSDFIPSWEVGRG